MKPIKKYTKHGESVEVNGYHYVIGEKISIREKHYFHGLEGNIQEIWLLPDDRWVAICKFDYTTNSVIRERVVARCVKAGFDIISFDELSDTAQIDFEDIIRSCSVAEIKVDGDIRISNNTLSYTEDFLKQLAGVCGVQVVKDTMRKVIKEFNHDTRNWIELHPEYMYCELKNESDEKVIYPLRHTIIEDIAIYRLLLLQLREYFIQTYEEVLLIVDTTDAIAFPPDKNIITTKKGYEHVVKSRLQHNDYKAVILTEKVYKKLQNLVKSIQTIVVVKSPWEQHYISMQSMKFAAIGYVLNYWYSKDLLNDVWDKLEHGRPILLDTNKRDPIPLESFLVSIAKHKENIAIYLYDSFAPLDEISLSGLKNFPFQHNLKTHGSNTNDPTIYDDVRNFFLGEIFSPNGHSNIDVCPIDKTNGRTGIILRQTPIKLADDAW